MKKTIITIFLLTLFLSGCNNNQELQEATNQTEKITNTIEEVPKESNTTIDEPEKNETNKNTKEKVFEYFENKDYATDGKNIYINVYDGGSSWIENYQIAKNIDKDSFQLLNIGYNSYFKDKNGVYYNTFSTYENLDNNIKFLKNIDPKSIKIISYHCINDKNGVYCDTPYDTIEKSIDMKKVLEADQETFVSLGKEEKYFKDKKNVFCNKYQKGINIQKLDNADVESFSIVANSSLDEFGKDKNNVFLLCSKVKGIEDVDSFEITQGNNGKDKLFEYTIDDNGTITKKTPVK